MSSRESITVPKDSLYRLAKTIPLTMAFLYFSKNMLFGPSTIWLPGVVVTDDLQITFQDSHGYIYLTGQSDFSKSGVEHGQIDFCGFQQNKGNKGCLEELNNQQIKVNVEESRDDGISCHIIQRKGLRCVNQIVKDCYNLGLDHWYGGFEAFPQLWPLRKTMSKVEDTVVTSEGDVSSEGMELPMGPYITGDYGVHKTSQMSVMDRIYFSSSGVGIIISKDSPLHLSFNQHGDGKLCMAATYDNAHHFSLHGKLPKLEYTVCKGKDVRAISDYIRKEFIPRPEGIPHKSLFTAPMWSTWAYYKKDINQSSVLGFTEKIVSSKLPYSQLVIDDNWTPQYGDLVFDQVKFPDAKKMMKELTTSNVPVSLWIHPFLSLKSEAFQVAVKNKFTVMAKNSEVPALVRWWCEDMAALLDVTNPAAVQWFQNNLQQLIKVYNVSSFKFDAGEGLFLPPSHSTYGQLSSSNEYATLWAELAHSADIHGRRQEVRVGWNSQSLPIVVRLMDRLSTWDYNGGLQSVIPTVLTMGVLGYPFLLTDMIGGNGILDIESLESTDYPDKELYIRWMQASLFMPCLQFSIPPWIYGEDIVTLTRNYLQLRESYAPTFISLAEESVQTGYPIIRPLWWIAPDDGNALIIDDQFMVGDDLLVAPVVVKGARKRNVYLPQGRWLDKIKESFVEGPVLLEDYPVTLNQLAYFERQQTE